MEIAETTKGAVKVLRPKGPLSLADAEQFKKCATEAAGTAMGRVVIDASGIPYVDSRGLEVLVELGETLSQSGQTLKLCQVNETLREVFDLTNVSGALEQYEDVNAAVR